jgi:hypothetical protein
VGGAIGRSSAIGKRMISAKVSAVPNGLGNENVRPDRPALWAAFRRICSVSTRINALLGKARSALPVEFPAAAFIARLAAWPCR